MWFLFSGLGIWYYRSRTNKTQSAEKEDKQIKKNVADAAASVSVPIETQKDAKKVNGIGKINEKESVAPVVEEEEDPFKQAQTYKNKGNKYFKEGKYSDAIKCYQQAIDVCPKDKIQDVSTFHQNRAAAFEQLVTSNIKLERHKLIFSLYRKIMKLLSGIALKHSSTMANMSKLCTEGLRPMKLPSSWSHV